MINLFKKDVTKTNQLHSITFRVSSEDKNKLTKQAEDLKISLSEYVRNKALFDDIELQNLFDENIKLKQQIKDYEIQLNSKISQESESGIIILRITEENKNLLKSILSFIHWNRFAEHPEQIEKDIELSKAIAFILVEYISEAVNEMRGLKRNYNINTIEDLYELFVDYYMNL
jgi:hypothetical protein